MKVRNVMIFDDAIFGDPRLDATEVFRETKTRKALHLKQLKDMASVPASSEQAAVSTCGYIFEEIVRRWLRQYFDLTSGRHLLWEQYKRKKRAWLRHCRELDAVSLGESGDAPDCIFEITVSTTGYEAIRRKRAQLKKSLSIAQERWPDVCGCVILINASGESLDSYPPGLIRRLRALDVDALEEALYDDIIPYVVIDLDVMWNYAKHLGWDLHSGLLRQVKSFAKKRRIRKSKRIKKRKKK